MYQVTSVTKKTKYGDHLPRPVHLINAGRFDEVGCFCFGCDEFIPVKEID